MYDTGALLGVIAAIIIIIAAIPLFRRDWNSPGRNAKDSITDFKKARRVFTSGDAWNEMKPSYLKSRETKKK